MRVSLLVSWQKLPMEYTMPILFRRLLTPAVLLTWPLKGPCLWRTPLLLPSQLKWGQKRQLQQLVEVMSYWKCVVELKSCTANFKTCYMFPHLNIHYFRSVSWIAKDCILQLETEHARSRFREGPLQSVSLKDHCMFLKRFWEWSMWIRSYCLLKCMARASSTRKKRQNFTDGKK